MREAAAGSAERRALLTMEAEGGVIPDAAADAALLCDSGLVAHLLGVPGADDAEGEEEEGEDEGEEEGEEDCEWELESEDEGSGDEGRLGSSAASSSAAADSGFMAHLLQQPWQPTAPEPTPPLEPPPAAPAAAAAAAGVSVCGGPWRDAARRDASRPLLIPLPRESELEGRAPGAGAPLPTPPAPGAPAAHAPAHAPLHAAHAPASAAHAATELRSASDVGALSLRDVQLLGGDGAATAPALGASISTISAEQQRKRSGVAAAVKRVRRTFAG